MLRFHCVGTALFNFQEHYEIAKDLIFFMKMSLQPHSDRGTAT